MGYETGSGAVNFLTQRTVSALASSPSYGMVAIGTLSVATQMPNATAYIGGVLLSADPANGGTIYMGFDNTLTTLNFYQKLGPGDKTELLPLRNVDQCYVYYDYGTSTLHNVSYGAF